MPTGKLKFLIHLSQQRHLPNTRLVPDHNDKGYGIIEDALGRDVYFSQEVVANRFGFEDRHKGQQLECRPEEAPYLRAASVKVASAHSAQVLRPAA
jgi:cold shock CspA family protein